MTGNTEKFFNLWSALGIAEQNRLWQITTAFRFLTGNADGDNIIVEEYFERHDTPGRIIYSLLTDGDGEETDDALVFATIWGDDVVALHVCEVDDKDTGLAIAAALAGKLDAKL
jgi:hypothetical protein